MRVPVQPGSRQVTGRSFRRRAFVSVNEGEEPFSDRRLSFAPQIVAKICGMNPRLFGKFLLRPARLYQHCECVFFDIHGGILAYSLVKSQHDLHIN